MSLLRELKFIPSINFNNDKEIGTLLIVLDAKALLGSPDHAMRPTEVRSTWWIVQATFFYQ